MRIGITSDTHGGVDGWRRVCDRFGSVDAIIHCGDVLYHGPRNPQPEGYAPEDLARLLNDARIPILLVRGNCDADIDLAVLQVPVASPVLVYEADGLRVVASHGHIFSDAEWLDLGRRWKAQFLVSGHTHRGSLVRQDGIVLFNPGSPCLPKEQPTAGLIDTAQRRAVLFSIADGRSVAEIAF